MASYPAQNLEPTNILAAVAELGVGGNGAFIDGEFNGGECRIFKISFKDHASIAVRVPHQVDDQDDIVATVQIEVHILQKLEEKGFHWSPRCCGFSLTFDNPIKYPFIILTWVEGSPLSWDDNFPPRPLRGALLDQIASIQLSLIKCTLGNRMHDVPTRKYDSDLVVLGSTSAATFFQRRMKNRSTQVREGRAPGLSEEDCINQQALVCQVLGQDQNDTAFAVEHGDIKPSNIIVDEDYNIKCVIDWGFCHLCTNLKSCRPPAFSVV
ncbi:kinase-like domain-containing protein [Trichoderma afarasin]